MPNAQGTPQARWIRLALLFGIAVPIVYFAIQLAVAPFYPDYDVTRDVASILGSPASPHADAFNAAVVAIGVMAAIGGVGQIAAIRARGSHVVLAVLAGLCVVSVGAATLWGGLVPLPNPAHGASSPFIMAGIVYPAIMLVVFWRRPGWRVAFALALAFVACSAAVMMGAIEIDRVRWAGAIQRPVALALIGPIGLASFALLRSGR